MKLIVDTPARLHLGLIDMNGNLGRLYGSLGVAIERPNLVLEAERVPGSDNLLVEGPESQRVEGYARRFLAHHPLSGRLRLAVCSAIPAHVGLGSGTQVALAVGAALHGLAYGSQSNETGSLVRPDAAILCALMGRGAHSGIGVAVFAGGGFVVDAGHATARNDGSSPPVLFQHPVPATWRFVVAVPAAREGLSGDAEVRAFGTLPPAPEALAEKICRRLLMQMLPALLEDDIAGFGQALSMVQELVGDGFAAVQGGRFGNSLSATLIRYLLERGALGAGQSSWGPTVYALVEAGPSADHVEAHAREFLSDRGGGTVFQVRVANHGASIELC